MNIHFQRAGSTGYYVMGTREQAHSFGGFREPCQKVKNQFKNLTLKKKPQFV